MHALQTQPYGEWASPITAARVAQGARGLASLHVADGKIYWLESRAAEGGRYTLVQENQGQQQEVTPFPANVRSRVHEYGGGAYTVSASLCVYSNFADNQMYVIEGNLPARALGNASHMRFADCVIDSTRARLIGVCEDHALSDIHAVNTLCALALDGSGTQTILAQGHDFYTTPRLSPDSKYLLWMTWDHPRMPWQGTQLWLAQFAQDGSLLPAQCIAGSESEAICQPEWADDGSLCFVSDRTGWWNLYRYDVTHQQVAVLLPMHVEFGQPHWTFGDSLYGFISPSEIVCSYIDLGVCKLARLTRPVDAAPHAPWQFTELACAYSDIHELVVADGRVFMIAAAPTIPLQVLEVNLQGGENRVLASSITELPEARYLSVPRTISFPSHGRQAYGMYYPPQNGDYVAPEQSKPPLLIFIHGGPTGMAANGLRLAIQYWTSRGFAVLDVNYAGSAGFGRDYRNLLQGQWGIADVQDCVAGAQYLAQQGLVDADRLLIRGGSAGGFTTLCALIFHDVFKAGTSLYGVSDLAGLDEDSHKFESQYNSYLIGPREQVQEIYRQRSPVHHAEKLTRPMIFLQGLDDKVVPPQQSQVMVQALRTRGVPVAYLEFAGEGHGFRKAENVQRALEAELYFYAKVLGFKLAERIEPVLIENM